MTLQHQQTLKQVEMFYLEYNHLPDNGEELMACGFDEETISTLFEDMVTDEDMIKAITQYLYRRLISTPNAVSKNFGRVIRSKAKKLNPSK